jgi:hypothetical protein
VRDEERNEKGRGKDEGKEKFFVSVFAYFLSLTNYVA